MNKEELFYKNTILSTEFSKYLIEHPEFAEMLPQDSIIILLPLYDEALYEENIKLADTHDREGKPVTFIEVGKMLPEKSRLHDLKLKQAV